MRQEESPQELIKRTDDECPDSAECTAERVCVKSPSNSFPLCATNPGQTVKLVRATGGRGLRSKLADMGLCPGSEIKVLTNLGGPMIIEVKGSRL